VDFRVENAVYEGDQKKPFYQSTTIFHGGRVYDCTKAPPEIVIFDGSVGQFTLLNTKHRVRAELTTEQVTSFVAELQQVAVTCKDPIASFLAAPSFEQSYDEKTGQLTFSSPWVSYQVTPVPQPDSAAEQYRQFTDWYARLNALLIPGSRPPNGRIAVNAVMAEQQAIPSQVLLKLTLPKDSRRPSTIRSEHKLSRSLLPADLDRVKEAQQSMASFKLVSFQQYRKLDGR
jgi:hypothetical protein